MSITRPLTDAEKLSILEHLKHVTFESYRKDASIVEGYWKIIESYTKAEMDKAVIYEGTFESIREQLKINLKYAMIASGRTIGADYAAVYISKLTQSTFKSFQSSKTGQTANQAAALIEYINIIINASDIPRHAKTNIHIIGSPKFDDICEYMKVLLYTRAKDVIIRCTLVDIGNLEEWQKAFIRQYNWNRRSLTKCLRLHINRDAAYLRGVLLTDLVDVIKEHIKIGSLELKIMWYDADQMFVDIYCDEDSIKTIGASKLSHVLSGIDPISKYLMSDAAALIPKLTLSGISGLYDMWPDKVWIPKYIKSIHEVDATKAGFDIKIKPGSVLRKASIVEFDVDKLDENGVYSDELKDMMINIFEPTRCKQVSDWIYSVLGSEDEVNEALQNDESYSISQLIVEDITVGNVQYITFNSETISKAGFYMYEIIDQLASSAYVSADDDVHCIMLAFNKISISPPLTSADIYERKVIAHTYKSIREHWYIVAKGSAYKTLASKPYVDFAHTTTNSIREVYSVLGIEGAYRAIKRELKDCEMNASDEIVSLLASVITCKSVLTPITKVGLIARNNGMNISELLSSRDPVDNISKFTAGGHIDNLSGIQGSIINGKLPEIGANLPRAYDTADYIKRLLALI